MSANLSIILPVLNEAEGIVQALERLQEMRRRGGEVIVVDGGSRDETAELAWPLADCVITAARAGAASMSASPAPNVALAWSPG